MAGKRGRRLNWLDRWLYRFLQHHVEEMPLRFCKMIAYFYADARIRKLYLKRIGVSLGECSYTNLGLIFATDNDLANRAIIGDHVTIAPNLTLICDAAAINGIQINQLPYVRDKITTGGDIIIEDDVWIGANVTILPGIRIGTCSMIGAGSVVIHDVEPYSLYVGVPARKIRDLKTGERTAKETSLNNGMGDIGEKKLYLFEQPYTWPLTKSFLIIVTIKYNFCFDLLCLFAINSA